MSVNRNNIKYAAACNSEMHNIFETNSAYDFSKNRVLARPLSGGVSLGNYLNMYGTLGGLFRDNTDGTIVGLTCRHVCDQMTCINVDGNAAGQFANGYPENYDFLRTRYTTLCDRLDPSFQINTDNVRYASEYTDNYNREYAEILYDKVYRGTTYNLKTFNRSGFAQNMNLVNKPMYQPGYPIFQPTIFADFLSGGSVPAFNANGFNTSRPYPQTIGHIKRVVPLITNLNQYNEIDSAVIAIEKSPNGDLMLDKSSCNFVGFNKKGGSTFATTGEINTLLVNPSIPLFKTGAGTGATGFGSTTTSCHTLSFAEFYDFISFEGVNYRNGIAFYIIDTSGNTSETIPLSTLQGDSGSMLWALFNSNSTTTSAWKIIGQIFAYSNDPLPVVGYASRIDRIQQALDISPWDGNNIVYTPKTPKYFTAYSVDEVITKMGRKCYRVSNVNAISASYILGDFQTPVNIIDTLEENTLTFYIGEGLIGQGLLVNGQYITADLGA